jgi:hypothetical protein
VWPQMERLKYLSLGRQSLLTFEGYGPYGRPVSSRNEALAETGFTADYLGHRVGFGSHRLHQGRVARHDDLAPALLLHMASYCAWRAQFAIVQTDSTALENMARTNFQREFGRVPENLALPVERPCICDARMAPQYWVKTPDSRCLKLEAGIHGDNHFFPGPCDIAWDLAGIIVEWEMSDAAKELLLTEYRRLRNDDVRWRIDAYELAYATFRMAWSKMAAASVDDPAEQETLLRGYARYRSLASTIAGKQFAIAV